MIQNDVVNQLQLLIKTVAPPLLEVAQTPLETPQLVPGQQLQATVLASLANGRFQALIGDQVLDLNLPKNTRPGDKLDLTFVTNQPRLTFVLSRDIPLPQGAKADVSISDTARFLGALLDKVASRSSTEAVPLTKTAPVLAAAPGNTTELAQALQKTVSQSGLFYESHQAQWLAGTRNTAQLMQEPQNQSADKIKAAFAHDENANQSSSLSAADASGKAGLPARISIPGIPDYLYPLIQQQLNALETRQVQWQGQIWSNQEMKWKINEESSRSASGEEERQWVTRIDLALPKLGEVTAILRFGSNGLSLTLDARENTTRAKLGVSSSKLISALSDRGINIASALVTQHDTTR